MGRPAGGTAARFRELLAGERVPPVILLAGEDDARREEALAALLEALPEETRATGVDRFDGGPLPRVLDAARTLPLLGGRRVVVARDPEGLAGGGEEARKMLLEWLAAPPAHAVLVLVVRRVDRRLKVVREIERVGAAFLFDPPREREMSAWIRERAAERGLRLAPAAAALLADAVGTDTGLAARELEKLALVVPREGQVTEALVAEMLGPHRAAGAFALEDALLEGRTAEALAALERELGPAPGPGTVLPLLGRLAGISRKLAVAAGVLSAGGGEGEVREALGCHPYVAKKYTRAARRLGGRAAAALASCAAADGRLKTGGEPRAALAAVVLALAPGPRRPAS